jgi:hypothetical protein
MLSDGVSNARKGSDYDFDLFIIRQFLDGLQPGCSMSAGQIQASAALAPSVSQQAFEHATGIRVAGVIPVRVTPVSKIPIGAAGFGD